MPEPRFPLYVVSKGRADTRLTSKALDRMGTDYRIVVEESEYEDYAANVGEKKLLVLDQAYKESYELLDEYGLEKSTGPGPARNFAWDHSMSEGHEWHWVMDDNIRHFRRFQNNLRMICGDGTPFFVMEEFCLRYQNVAMAGPNYMMFVPRKYSHPPFIFNSRIYSCNLIRNDVPFRWRGRYNEDTILSLDMLKAKWCLVQFNMFLQEKMNTQALKGGNTEEFYAKEGTVPKSQMLVNVHPDVSTLKFRFGRPHHHVNYTTFKKNNRLVLKEGIEIPKASNDFGMKLVPRRK